MRGLKLFIFLILVTLLISACSNITSFKNPFIKKDKEEVGQGLKLYFGQNAPPRDKILVGSGSSFVVTVRADNWGKEPITNYELEIWDNIPGTTLENLGERKLVEIKGADVIREGGVEKRIPEVNQLLYSEKVRYSEDEIADDAKLNIFAELKFNYIADLQGRLCLKREDDFDPSCSNSEIMTTNSLGGEARHIPVTIDKVEKTATPLDEGEFFVDLEITLRNNGGGEISSVGTGKDDKDIKDNIGQVITDFTIDSPAGFECSPSIITFADNVATVNCFNANLETGLTSNIYPLNIKYSFPYKMRIKAGPITLQKVGG